MNTKLISLLAIIAIAAIHQSLLAQSEPLGATLSLSAPTDAGWNLPATVEITITQPASSLFTGSNGREETGGPVFSSQPFNERAAFYQCDTVTGFPAGGGYVHNRVGGSSFIAQKVAENGTVKTWICASMGSFTSSGGPGSYREFQIRYFSGDLATGAPPSMILCHALPGGNLSSTTTTVTNFKVDVHYAPSDITIHRLQPNAIANRTMRDGWDGNAETMLVPTKNMDRLAASSVDKVRGLVADGVTPLLIQIKKKNLPYPPVYRLRAKLKTDAEGNPVAGGTITGLHTRVSVLWQDGWRRTPDKDGYHNAYPWPLREGEKDVYIFAVLDAIRPDEVQLNPGSTGISCELELEEMTDDGYPSGRKEVTPFKIVKPPIVLVHGYFSDGSTWQPSFMKPLKDQRPNRENGDFEDFVIPITYPDSTSGDFDDLAQWLEMTLETDIEYSEGPIFKNWAITRYDIIAHSQGGILSRMLCQNYSGTNVPRFADRPFRNTDNHYRGRFGRVVTLGSPQNGLRNFRYIHSLRKTNYFALPMLLHFGGFGPLQPKFDPYGEQIAMVNDSNYRADLGSKFHLITTTITDGLPPQKLAIWPPCYAWIPGFTIPKAGDTKPRGEYVYPKGSDGGVDPDSGAAYPPGYGSAVNKTFAMPGNISHAAFPPLFGVAAVHSQTADPDVAKKALSLLDGVTSAFGPFVLPKNQTDSQVIDDLVPNIHDIQFDLLLTLPDPSPSPDGPQPAPPPGGASTYTYRVQPTASEPLEGPINWFAEAFSPHGPTADGIMVEPDASDPTKVTVTVEDTVEGDVVLYGNYPTTNNRVVMGRPTQVVARPTTVALTGIELRSSDTELVVGKGGELIVWGVYSDGSKAPVFTGGSGGLQIVSSAPATAIVAANGLFTTHAPGEVTFTASFRGFSAGTTVASEPPPATNSLLTSLIPAGETLSPAFSSGVHDYAVKVPYETDSFALAATVADPGASLRVFDNDRARTLVSGATSGPIALSVGTNEIHVQVTAEDGVSTRVYTVSVERAEMFPLQLEFTHPTAAPEYVAFHGESMAAEGNLVAVGAILGGGNDQGSVTVYDSISGAVRHFIRNPTANDFTGQFGSSVALSGNLLAVGKPGAEGDTINKINAVYIYDLSSAEADVPVFTLLNPGSSNTHLARFGASVAIQGSVVVVGAPLDDKTVTDAGTAYVYNLQSATPTVPVRTIQSPTPKTNSEFGHKVAIGGKWAVIGEPYAAGLSGAGQVFVYDLTKPVGSGPDLTLRPTDNATTAYFGSSLAMSGSRLLVGAPGNAGSGSGSASGGKVYLFELEGGTSASPNLILTSPIPQAFAGFGTSVAISGNRVMVGAIEVTLGAETDAGAAYYYEIDRMYPNIPVLVMNNPTPATEDFFGTSVAISGPKVIVGAPREDSQKREAGMAYLYETTGPLAGQVEKVLLTAGQEHCSLGHAGAISGSLVAVAASSTNGPPSTGTGSVHVFDLGSSTPSLPLFNIANPVPATWSFGESVALSGTLLAVGAPDNKVGSTDYAGSVYVYDLRHPAPLTPVVILDNPSAAAGDTNFGASLAISGNLLVVGAPYNYGASLERGAVYFYDLASPVPGVPIATLRNPKPGTQAGYFGHAVDIKDGILAVGCPSTTYYDARYKGWAYVYSVQGNQPVATPLLAVQNPVPNPTWGQVDIFGHDVTVQGRKVAVSDHRRNTVFVYDIDQPGAASNPRIIPAPLPCDGFGYSIAMSGSALAVADYRYDMIYNANLPRHGVVYIYALDDSGSEDPVSSFFSPHHDDAITNQFGFSVAMDGGRILVGSKVGQPGMEGGQAYIFGTPLPPPDRPSVRVFPAPSQANPTSAASVVFRVEFSEPVSGFSAADVSLGGSAGATRAVVSGSGTSYHITVDGMSGSGTVTLRAGVNAAQAASGKWNTASPESAAVIYVQPDTTPPAVTVEQAATQTDPTSSLSVEFAVIFSEPVTGLTAEDVVIGGTAGATNAAVSGGGAFYKIVVSGIPRSGTVSAAITAGAAQDQAGNSSTASSSMDNVVTHSSPYPTVTINQQTTQVDPTSSSPLYFIATFSKPVTGFNSSDLLIGGTAGATSAIVNGNGTFFAIIVSGMTRSGTVTVDIPAGVAENGGYPNNAATSSDNSVTYNMPPTVTINQALGQNDPAESPVIRFDIVFNEPVTGFTSSDVVLEGTAGASTVEIAGNGSTYQAVVTGMTHAGTVIARIGAGGAKNLAGLYNSTSSSSDNVVTYNDSTSPTVIVRRSSNQSSTTTNPIVQFDVIFSKPVNGFDYDDIKLVGTTCDIGYTSYQSYSGKMFYLVGVQARSTGTVVLNISPGAAQDSSGRQNSASTPGENFVHYQDLVSPTVAVNQKIGQVDPSTVPAVYFMVEFSEAVTDFHFSDLVFGGTAGIESVRTSYSSSTYYEIEVKVRTKGTVSASLPAGTVTDVSGNPNLPSSSVDNSVTVDIPNMINDLSNLVITPGNLSPAFTPAHTAYVINVPYSTDSVTVTPTSESSAATIKVGGSQVSSGTQSGAIPLNVGQTFISIKVTAEAGGTKTYSLTINRAANTYPEIAVKQPGGANLIDGVSSWSFGSVTFKSSVTGKFTIKNLGTANLKNLAISKNGANANEFTVTAPKSKTLAPGDSTTFKVTFKPSAKGTRKAAIHIASNDSNENPFDITLTGKGVTIAATPVIFANPARLPSWNNLKLSTSMAGFAAIWQQEQDSRKVTTTVELANGRKYLALRVTRTPGELYLKRTVEVSPNLINWYSGTEHTTIMKDDAKLLKVRDNTPLTPGTKRFIRLKEARD